MRQFTEPGGGEPVTLSPASTKVVDGGAATKAIDIGSSVGRHCCATWTVRHCPSKQS